MSDKKVAKQKAKLVERIKMLEDGLRLALQKKSSSQQEVDVPGTTRQIAELKQQLALLGEQNPKRRSAMGYHGLVKRSLDTNI